MSNGFICYVLPVDWSSEWNWNVTSPRFLIVSKSANMLCPDTTLDE